MNQDNALSVSESAVCGETCDKQGKPRLFKRIGSFLKKHKVFTGFLCAFMLAVVVYVLSRTFQPFAEFWTRYPSQWVRTLLGWVTSLVKFSLAEVVILLLIPAAVVYTAYSFRQFDKGATFFHAARPLLCFLLAVLTLFLGCFAPAYFRYGLAQNLELERSEVTSKELYETAKAFRDEIAQFEGEIVYPLDGKSFMPYSYSVLVEKINDAYESFASKHGFISTFRSYSKPVAFSDALTYTHIAGIYTFFTGEANVNTNYPDYVKPFTMAHEMAHQRGIAREDEANFVAFLVCLESDDPYIRYSAYVNIYEYLLSALRRADTKKYAELLESSSEGVLCEFDAYAEFFDEYRDSTASAVSGAVNDVSLKAQGQSAGTKSYGLVVDLAVSYFKAGLMQNG